MSNPVKSSLTIAGVLIALLMMTPSPFGLRRPDAAFTFSAANSRPPSAPSYSSHSSRSSHTSHNSYNYEAALLNQLAPFEIQPGEFNDPFLREKRATAFQTHIDALTLADFPHVLAAIDSIHAANPTEAATELRDRLLQRWRELSQTENVASAVADQESPTTSILILSDTNPITAATLALQTLPPDRDQQNLLIGILQRWALHDLNGASAWANQFPDGELRDRAFTQLARLTPRAQDSPEAQ
jgi:hypothetical protein